MGRVHRTKELATFLSASRSSALYCGFVGWSNLGDEVLWEQIRSAFAPMRMVCAPPMAHGVRKKIVELKKWERVILGGGTLIGGNLPDGSNPFREHFRWFRSRARRAVAFGTGVGQVSDNPAENSWLLEWKPLLEEFEYIGVRGPISVRSLASIGIDAELLGDPACLISQGPGFWSSPQGKVLGINVGEVHGRSDALKAKERNLVDVLSNLVHEKAKNGWRIEFFVVTPSDCHVIDTIVRQSSLQDYKIHEIYSSGHQYINTVRNVTAFVGMKLHSVILAMCAGVPSVMISYSPKCRDFMMSVELDDLVVDLERADLESLNTKLDMIMMSGNKISEHTTKQMAHFRAKQLSRAKFIRSSLFA